MAEIPTSAASSVPAFRLVTHPTRLTSFSLERSDPPRNHSAEWLCHFAPQLVPLQPPTPRTRSVKASRACY